MKAEAELAFYRIAQEALNNVHRHAKAARASVVLSYQSDHVSLTIQDDGKGFRVPESPAEFAPSGHFGLLGIHEKAERIGAKFEINSEPNKGSELKLSLKL